MHSIIIENSKYITIKIFLSSTSFFRCILFLSCYQSYWLILGSILQIISHKAYKSLNASFTFTKFSSATQPYLLSNSCYLSIFISYEPFPNQILICCQHCSKHHIIFLSLNFISIVDYVIFCLFLVQSFNLLLTPYWFWPIINSLLTIVPNLMFKLSITAWQILLSSSYM